MNLSQLAAYQAETPYELWQKGEGLPTVRGHCVEDLRAMPLGAWKRKGVSGAFINLVGSGRTCDAYVCEIQAKGQTEPQRHLFEFSTHEEADLKEHDGGIMGHGSFRRMVLQRLLEDGMADARTGYSLEYCGMAAVDLHGVILQAALNAAG